MQVILGANGVIGRELATSLTHYTKHIRLVSRNPKKVNSSDEIFPADLLDRQRVNQALKGADIAYLTVGLPYQAKAWAEQWPKIMDHVVEACHTHQCRLVFFSNVYSLGRVRGKMTEMTPMNPCSRKGEIRAGIESRFLDEINNRSLQGILIRSADFYGPATPLSFVNIMVFEKLRTGRKPLWMGNPDALHSLTFTPDAGTATALLGNTPDTWNQIWNIPTHRDAPTGRSLIQQAARHFGRRDTFTTLSPLMVRMAGMLNPVVRESIEMLYQNTDDYLFDSTKFEQRFQFHPTTYAAGIEITARSMMT